MVQRTSERLNLQGGQPLEVAVQPSGRVAPQNTGGIFDNQVATKYPDLVAVPTGHLDPVVQALFQIGGKVTDQIVQRKEQEAYLNGALALGAGLSEDQLQANPLTRQWAVAGYRDAVGRLAMAEYEAQVAKDMQRLREAPPEEMARYLQSARRRLMPVLDRMSSAAKDQLFPQLLTSEQASLAAHGKAHQEFMVETTMTALQTGYGAVVEKLFQTEGPSDPRYNSALMAAASYLGSNVWNNPSLPHDAKVKLLSGAVESAMARGDTGLFQWLQAAEVPGPDGTPTTLWNQLDFKTQTSLAKAYRTSLGQNDARMHADWWDKEFAITTALERGQVPVTFDEYYAHLMWKVSTGTMTPEAMNSKIAAFAKASGQQFEKAGAVNAILTGDPTYLVTNGISEKKAAEWAVQSMAQEDQEAGRPIGYTFNRVANSAIQTGSGEMMAQATALLEPQINVLMNSPDGEIDPQAASILMAWSHKIDEAKKRGNAAAQENALALLPEAKQDWIRTYMAVRRKYARRNDAGGGIVEATDGNFLVAETRKLMEWRTNLSPQERQAFALQRHEDAEKAILDLSETGKLGEFGGAFTGLFSESARARTQLTSAGRWFSNDAAYREQENLVLNAIRDEYRELSRTEFGWDAQDLADKAMANVANRSIRTDYGLMILPRDVDLQAMFGAPAATSTETLGLAVNRIMKAEGVSPDRTVSFNVAGGALHIVQYDEDGVPVSAPMTILAKQIGPVVQDILTGEDTVYNHAFGTGKVREGKDGSAVRFNGENSVGIDPKLALRLRDMLVDHEGVTRRPYPDGSGGRTSVGVGMNSGSDWYPRDTDFDANGNLKPEALSYYFTRASDAAMKSANQAISYWQFSEGDENLMHLFTSMAYQGGIGFFTNSGLGYEKFLTELKVGTEESALAALTGTKAYEVSPDSRKKWYADRVKEHFHKR